MASLLRLGLLALFAAAGVYGQPPVKCPATLKGWAYLPAGSSVKAPGSAPDFFDISGRYQGSRNWLNETLYAYPACAGPANPTRCTNFRSPYRDQAVQGFSGIKTIRDKAGRPTGEYYTMTDNGLGNKRNSPDCLLMFHRMRPDWRNNNYRRITTTFLSDPYKRIPFLIRNAATRERYLTGADLDIESIQFVGESVWIGDEFGPYLVEFSRGGTARGLYEVPLPGQPAGAPSPALVRSPDNEALSLPNPDGSLPPYNLKRSKGFEGMAYYGEYLYPLLEGPLYVTVTNSTTNTTSKQYEMYNGLEYLHIFRFSTKSRTWVNWPGPTPNTTTTRKYLLDANGNAIGDFNMIDERYGLVLERDNNEGDPAGACPAGQVRGDCWEAPAAYKRVYLVDMEAADDQGFVRKVAYVDLMDIKDPEGRSPRSRNGVLTFPFVTIENVDWVNKAEATVVVGNDNNFPGSMGRSIGKADDNELALLQVPCLFNGGKL